MSWAELSIALFNTLIVASGVLLLAVPIAFLLAVLIARTNVLGAGWAWLALSSQLVVPLYATVGAWSAGFGSQGWWPLSQTLVVRSEWSAIAAVTFIHAVAAIPSCLLILMLGLVWSRRSQDELALIDGGMPNLIYRVLLPEMRGWLAAAGLWAIVPVLTEMLVTNLYQVPTLAEQVYLDISLGTASSMTYVVSVGLCMLPLLVLAWLLRRQLPSLSRLASHMAQHRPQPLALRAWRVPLSLLMWAIVLAIVAIPLLNLWLKAGWESRLTSSGLLAHRWSWNRLWLTLIETSTLFHAEFHWSATLALASSSTAIVAAALLRWRARRRWSKRAIDFLSIVLVAMPGPLVASLISQVFLSGKVPGLAWAYDHSLAAPILAQQTRLFPLAWLLVGGILASVSSRAWEMASIDRLSAWSRLHLVLWRPTWRLWLAAWLLLAAMSAGELSTHLLLLPPGVTTLAQRLFEFLHFGMRYQDSGLCLALVLLGWLVAIVVWKTRSGRA